MTIIKPNIVDAVGIDKETDDAILTIIDPNSWENVTEHLTLLQNKINKYLDFIESGEIFESYPKAKNRKLMIKLIMRYSPPHDATSFLEEAERVLESIDINFEYEIKS